MTPNKLKIIKFIKNSIKLKKIKSKEGLLNNLDVIFDEMIVAGLVIEEWRDLYHQAAIVKYMESL